MRFLNCVFHKHVGTVGTVPHGPRFTPWNSFNFMEILANSVSLFALYYADTDSENIVLK